MANGRQALRLQESRERCGPLLRVSLLCLLKLLLFLPSYSMAVTISGDSQHYQLTRNIATLKDSAGDLAIDQVMDLYRTSDSFFNAPVPSFGMEKSVYWFVVPLTIAEINTQRWVLRFVNPYLDYIHVYRVSANNRIEVQNSGALYPFDQRPYQYHQFAFPLNLSQHSEELLILRIQAITSPMAFEAVLQPERDFRKFVVLEYLGQGLYFGIMAVMIFYNLFLFIAIKDSSYFYYVCYVFMAACYQLAVQGLGYQFVWDDPELKSLVIIQVSYLIIFFAGYFCRRFLTLTHYSKPLSVAIFWISWVSLSLMLVTPFVSFQMRVSLASLISFIGYILIVSAGVIAWRRGCQHALYFVLAWAILVITVIWALLTYHGVLANVAVAQYGTQWGTAAEVTLLSLALASRINQLKAQQQQSAQDHAVAQAESRAKSEFLAQMSHEIRTPMNGVLGMAELLKQTKLQSSQKHFVDIIYSSGQSLLGIINDILDFSKIEAGKVELEKIEFELSQVVQEAVDLFLLQAEAKGLQFSAALDLDLPRSLYGDPTRIRQILLNFLSNAFKFTKSGFVHLKVDVQTLEVNHLVMRFAVEDSGVGISKEAQEKLFRAFNQAAASTSREYGGTGLGLVICKQFAELMGGEIGVESEEGAGATFWFTARLEQAGEASLVDPQIVTALRNEKVLLLENDEFYREFNEKLSRAYGYELQTLSEVDFNEDIRLSMMPDIIVVCWNVLTSFSEDPGTSSVEHSHQVEIERLQRFLDKLGFGMASLVLFSSTRDRAIFGNALTENASLVEEKPALINLIPYILHSMLVGKEWGDVKSETTDSIPKTNFSAMNVLVAEDNNVNQMVIKGQLKRLGIDPVIVGDGQQAIEKYRKCDFDLILMDCEMPNIDGFGATKVIRELELTDGREEVPIIALTAHAMKEYRDRVVESGMNDHLSKPVTLNNLERCIRRWHLN